MILKVKFADWLPKGYDKSVLVPKRAHEDDAGFDLVAAESGTVYVGQKARIATGIEVEIEPGYEGQVRSRSGLASKHSLFVINSPGTIDAGYRGEIVVLLHNLGGSPYSYQAGDRVGQLVISKLPDVEVVVCETLNKSDRGAGGFGSSGR